MAIRYSVDEFARRGGFSQLNTSGWGVSFYRERDCLLFKEAKPAFESAWVHLIASQFVESRTIIAHVRDATAGVPRYENTHPFSRELGGRAHVFAHNGNLTDFRATLQLEGRFTPLGDTDSEHAFCYLLDRLRPLWEQESPPALDRRLAVVAEAAAQLSRLGSANFIYFDGDCLFAHGDQRKCRARDAADPGRLPGLHIATRHEYLADAFGAAAAVPKTDTLILASVPLSSSAWRALPRGTILALRSGVEVARRRLDAVGRGEADARP